MADYTIVFVNFQQSYGPGMMLKFAYAQYLVN